MTPSYRSWEGLAILITDGAVPRPLREHTGAPDTATAGNGGRALRAAQIRTLWQLRLKLLEARHAEGRLGCIKHRVPSSSP